MESGFAMSHTPGFVRRFLPVWCIGMVGVAALLLQEPPRALLDQSAPLRELPTVAVRLLLLLNPLILLTVMVAVGAALAHRVGLRSRLAGDADARLDIGAAALLGWVVALVIQAIDFATASLLGPGWQTVADRVAAASWVTALMLGMLYGGIAEEVIMRWGLMSLVVWACMRVTPGHGHPNGQPSTVAAGIGIVMSALIFAIGHLPALALSVDLSGPIVARTVGLNLLAGIAYGWLFWRRGLECAMLAHAMTHLGFAAGRWLT